MCVCEMVKEGKTGQEVKWKGILSLGKTVVVGEGMYFKTDGNLFHNDMNISIYM